MMFHTKLLQSSISQLLACNKLEVFLEDDCNRSRLIECQSLLNRKMKINPEYRVLMFLPSTVHVLCSTWFIEVNRYKMLMAFVSGINGQKRILSVSCLNSDLQVSIHC